MTGQAALVTGSSRGIGLAIAQSLANEGFSIAINGPVDDDELRNAVDSVKAQGVNCVAAPFDVSNIDVHATELDRIEAELGPLTTLVNNAGVGVLDRGDPLYVSPESYDRCMAINARAMFFLTQSFSRRLTNRDRDDDLTYSITNITSSNATAVAEPRAEYAASKAAAAMISKSFAVRLGRENIAVYDVQPGLIATDMTAPVIESYRERAEAGLTLLPRVGQPEEIGQIVATLATGKLPYTTGHVISADGGLLVERF